MTTQKTTQKKPFVRRDVGLQRAGALDMSSLRDLAMRHPETFVQRFEDLVAQKKFGIRSIPDLRTFFRTFLDVKVKTTVDVGDGIRAAVDTSAFPLLMGGLVVEEINDAYAAVPTIGQDLVREIDSNKKFTQVVKMTSLVEKQTDVAEGQEFPMISAGEQFASIGSKRKGFQLAISQETLEENDLGNFIDLINQGGEYAAELIEELTLSRVCDQNGSAAAPGPVYTYMPNGAGTALYTTTAGAQTPSGTRVTSNALAATSNLDAVRTVLAKMLNTRLKRVSIPMSECTLLVPDALAGTAQKLIGSEQEPGVVNELSVWGPRGQYRPRFRSTPKLDDISTTAWYLGAFERQFIRKWKIRLETVSVYADAMQYARTREAYRTRVAWDVEVGARDNIFVVQSLSGTTPPTASTI